MAEQILEIEWPSGNSKPVALIRPEPSELSERFGWTFTEDVDDLDYLSFVALRLSGGTPVLLMRHQRAPADGTEVYADREADTSEVLGALLVDMALSTDDLLWSSDA